MSEFSGSVEPDGNSFTSNDSVAINPHETGITSPPDMAENTSAHLAPTTPMDSVLVQPIDNSTVIPQGILESIEMATPLTTQDQAQAMTSVITSNEVIRRDMVGILILLWRLS